MEGKNQPGVKKITGHFTGRPIHWILLGAIASATLAYFILGESESREGSRNHTAARPGSELKPLLSRQLVPVAHTSGDPEGTPGTTTAAELVDGSESDERLDGGLLAQLAMIDPASTDWMSEQLTDRVGRQFDFLKKALAAPPSSTSKLLTNLLAADCRSSALLPDMSPDKDTRIGEDAIFSTSGTASRVGEFPHAGAGQVAAELEHWGKRFEVKRMKFKVVAVTRGDDGQFETTVLVQGDRISEGGTRSQEAARWRVGWQSPTDGKDGPPLMQDIELERAERSDLDLGGETLYADVTAAAMAGIPAYAHQYLQGNNHWARVIPQEDGGALLGYNGLAVGDANGDGLDDLYVPDGGSLPNRLLIHRADGTLADQSVVAGVDWLEQTISALFVDLDNDGDQDLVAAAPPFLLFMENDGRGKFTSRGVHQSATNPYSLVAADFDGDRLLDLYLCNYSGSKPGGNGSGTISSYPIPYTDAENGMANVLLKNLGEFGFRDVTAETGLDANNTRFSQAAMWEDFDGDGDPDLYVANDFGRNNLYRNDTGATPLTRHFVDIAAEAGVEDQASGMSVAWGDYDRDGRPDLYVANMFSAAGNRVTFQERFTKGRSASDIAATRRMARGNTLFRSRKEGGFEDLSEAAGVAMARWAWGSVFADLDNDGWEDLVVANGYLTNDRADDL